MPIYIDQSIEISRKGSRDGGLKGCNPEPLMHPYSARVNTGEPENTERNEDVELRHDDLSEIQLDTFQRRLEYENGSPSEMNTANM